MTTDRDRTCPDCAPVNRRDFVRSVGSAALAIGALPWLEHGVSAAPSFNSDAETSAKALYESLSDDQKKTICFPFDHELRTRISANWKITKPPIGDDFYSKDQRKLIDQIVRGVTSEDGYERLQQQMTDDSGGFENYHIALFGEPGSGKFEWEMTGRHLTLRADGDCVEGMAFGGPIVYGHSPGNPRRNVFHYQTQKTNEVFKALDGKQQEKALLPKAPPESRVPIQGEKGTFPGISVSELSADQRKLVEEAIRVILAPYRKEDIDEAMEVIKAGGGVEKLHMSFYETGDLLADKVWDIWRLEGPTFVWHFRGAPHVHAYVHVGRKA